ncbi:MAG: hypothetical protein VKL39_09210 [Leptolyngbyaceae bacterium]|nr:hypothetical protein [Leptolyngbyaceae bacterium]
MIPESTKDEVRQQALMALMTQFVQQGHPDQYAQYMATSAIFQADLELRNAQLNQLLGWLQQSHPEVYTEAIAVVEGIREEFEKRLDQ